MGCLNALLSKFTQIDKHPSLETVLFVLISYSTFLLSECLEFTGIVSVLFCGIFQAHYTYNNLAEESKKQTREFFGLLNFLSENFIFLYIGITMFTFGKHQWEWQFILFSFLAIFVARLIIIYPLSLLVNLSRKKTARITWNMQHVMLFSGLRGAMAFALAIRNTSSEARQLILTSTSIIVIVTVVFCGGLTENVIKLFKIKIGIDIDNNTEREKLNKKKELKSNLSEISLASKGGETKKKSFFKRGIFQAWRGFDKKYMKPFLTHATPSLITNLPHRFIKIAQFLTSKEQLEVFHFEIFEVFEIENNIFFYFFPERIHNRKRE
jgi:solute carrier family 9 (sodium/hydrogen exchanger), member 6/7